MRVDIHKLPFRVFYDLRFPRYFSDSIISLRSAVCPQHAQCTVVPAGDVTLALVFTTTPHRWFAELIGAKQKISADSGPHQWIV